MYTSGTTGLPKGIMHSHRVRAMYALLLGAAWRMTPESVVLHTGAIVFNGAFVTLMPAFHLGATYILQRQFDAAAMIAAIAAREGHPHHGGAGADHRPARFAAFDPAKLASLQMILSLGAPLAQAAQGPAQPPAARPLPRTLRPHRGLRHHPRQDRRGAQVRLGRLPAALQRGAHRR
jgi:acyl-coenzyme A synthetase/AMP-(fatty) acid ligase